MGSIIEFEPGRVWEKVLLKMTLCKIYQTSNQVKNLMNLIYQITLDILSFDNISLESDLAQGMIFEVERTGVIHNFTKNVDPGYKDI